MSSIVVLIDDREIEAKPAQTIMEAADGAGISIPRLCNHPSLKPSGSCRLCAVEIEGYRGLPAACTTPVENGMRVRTESPKVLDFRRETLRLILQDHPRQCLGCPRNGTCELQQLVTSVGIDFPYMPPSLKRPPLKPGGAYFERDYSLCVRCGRCVRVCHEVRGAKAIVFREREGRQEVGTPLGRSLAKAGCEFCGACVDACPVGALRETPDACQGEGRARMLQICENLADIVMTLYRAEMPRLSKTSVCPVCTAGCGMDFETAGEREVVQVRPALNGEGGRAQACLQGRFLLKHYLRRTDRILKPLVGKGPDLREESWENTLELVARKFKSYGPGEIAVLTNARLGSEDLYLLRKFARDALNTKLVGCTAPYGNFFTDGILRAGFDTAGCPADFGELRNADCIVAFGFNPPASHPIAGVRLREAVMSGTKLVTAGPCETAPSRYADIHLRHYPGTEIFVASGLVRLLLDANQAGPGVARRHGPELESLREGLSEYSPETVSKITGVPESDLMEAACLIGNAKVLSIVYGTGLFASSKHAEALRAIRALMLIGGSAPGRGATVLPAFGGGNSQGEQALRAAFDSSSYEDVFDALARGRVKALYLAAESMEDDALGSLGPWLGKLDFALIQDVAMPGEGARKTLPSSCAFLPMASILENGGTFTCGGEKIRRIEPVLPAPVETRSVRWVLGALSRLMGVPGFDYETAEAVLDEMRGQVPFYAESQPSGRGGPPGWADWKPAPLEVPRDLPDEQFPFALVVKEHLGPYFLGPLLADETATLFHCPEDVEMNPADVFSMGLAPGDTVRVVTRNGECEGRLGMNHFLSPKMVAVPTHLPHIFAGGECECVVSAARIEKR